MVFGGGLSVCPFRMGCLYGCLGMVCLSVYLGVGCTSVGSGWVVCLSVQGWVVCPSLLEELELHTHAEVILVAVRYFQFQCSKLHSYKLTSLQMISLHTTTLLHTVYTHALFLAQTKIYPAKGRNSTHLKHPPLETSVYYWASLGQRK